MVLLTRQLQEKSSRNRPPSTSPNSRLRRSGQFGRHHEPSWLRRAFLENDNETGWEGRLGQEKLRQGRSRRGGVGGRFAGRRERLNLPAARSRGSLPPSPLPSSPPLPSRKIPGCQARLVAGGVGWRDGVLRRPNSHCPELGGNGGLPHHFLLLTFT